jgi:hypothetical protein
MKLMTDSTTRNLLAKTQPMEYPRYYLQLEDPRNGVWRVDGQHLPIEDVFHKSPHIQKDDPLVLGLDATCTVRRSFDLKGLGVGALVGSLVGYAIGSALGVSPALCAAGTGIAGMIAGVNTHYYETVSGKLARHNTVVEQLDGVAVKYEELAFYLPKTAQNNNLELSGDHEYWPLCKRKGWVEE